MNRVKEYPNRYQKGYVFCDPETEFTLDLAGFFDFEQQTSLDAKWPLVLQKINQIESGDIVNRTQNPDESENRPVDHFNLRHPEELVSGKSSGHSLDYWQNIKSELSDLNSYDNVVFNGIGGSYLGPLMALIFSYGERFNQELDKTVYFLANADPKTLGQIENGCDLKKTIFVHISKSGGTAETAANLEAVRYLYEKSGIEFGPNQIAVTMSGSKLDEIAKAEKFKHSYSVNEATGGRTSIVSAVGMVPFAICGLDYAEFLRGMQHMDSLTRRNTWQDNPAALLAAAIDTKIQKLGPKNMILLGYRDSLKEYAHYCQQLFMESLGKNYTIDNQAIKTGLTCFGGIGTGEQHAFMQQVQKGIQDSFVRFYSFHSHSNDYSSSKAVSMGNLLTAFLQGTQTALLQNEVDFISQIHSRDDLFNLGMMIALEERTVSILASLWHINAYDQPGVQDGKKAADVYLATLKHSYDNLPAKIPCEGTALEITRILGLGNEQVPNVDRMLSDLCFNSELGPIQTAFGKPIEVTRQWVSHTWRYNLTFK